MEEIELKYSSLVGKLKSNINYKRNQWQNQIENYRQSWYRFKGEIFP